MASGLAIDSSDMDILVSLPSSKEPISERLLLIEQMRRLHHTLSQHSSVESLVLIESASVPVIKLVTKLFIINSSVLTFNVLGTIGV